MAETATYLNVTEAAALLDVKPTTIYQLVWQRKLPYYKPLGKKLMFCKEELLAIIAKGRHATTTELETVAATAAMKRRAK